MKEGTVTIDQNSEVVRVHWTFRLRNNGYERN